MEKIAKFHKVSKQRFEKDWGTAFPGTDAAEIQRIYEALRLPVRATKGSAGYDFFAPAAVSLKPRETIKIPTGIRAEIQEGWVLQLFPRSSMGFTYRLQFNNTVGIIDSDYFESDNEGHIFIKMMNDSTEGKTVQIRKGDGFAQGIFLPFGRTLNLQLFLLCAICVQQVRIHIVSINKYICKVLWKHGVSCDRHVILIK